MHIFFNTDTIVDATISFSEYESITDWSLMPWEFSTTKKGIVSRGPALIQSKVVDTPLN
jgi:hypothetical protein